jgi:hypothetical protein
MRRIVALAGAAGLALGIAPFATTPASACEPQKPPYCQTTCDGVRADYYRVNQTAGRPLPAWYDLDLEVCGS